MNKNIKIKTQKAGGKKDLHEKKCRIRPKDIKGVRPTNDCSKWDDFTIKNV